MSQSSSVRKPVIDWLTVVGIAALATSLTVVFHEGVHMLACVVLGGDLQGAALYASCESTTEVQATIVIVSAPAYNLLAGLLAWRLFRHSWNRSSESQFFLWLFMLMNWFYFAGYFVFSGLTNVGDWSIVIEGWQPIWLWRVLMTLFGLLLFVFFVRRGLIEFGRVACKHADEHFQCVNRLCILSYFTSFLVILFAGFFCPYGLTSLPVTATLFAGLGALSPFLLMMRWFRAGRFAKLADEPLEIHRRWRWIVTSLVVVFVYAFVVGRTLYF